MVMTFRLKKITQNLAFIDEKGISVTTAKCGGNVMGISS